MSLSLAKFTNRSHGKIMNKVNGYMTAAVPIAIMTGGFLSSLILSLNLPGYQPNYANTENFTDTLNSSYNSIDYEDLNMSYIDANHQVCGPHFCPLIQHNDTSNGKSDVFEDIRVFYILLCVLASFAVMSNLLLVCFLSNLPPEQYTIQWSGMYYGYIL
jgi:hypothetical protein